MKRKIRRSAKRKKIQKQAFDNMKKAKENIGPDMLEKARHVIAKAVQNQAEVQVKKTQAEQTDSEQDAPNDKLHSHEIAANELVAIDRRKNLMTVMALIKDLDESHPLQEMISKDLKSLKDKNTDCIH